jgi:hypothetical protein
MAQKQSLTQIYETFRRENERLAEAESSDNADPAAGKPAAAPDNSHKSAQAGKSAETIKQAKSTRPVKKVAKKATKKAAPAAEEE